MSDASSYEDVWQALSKENQSFYLSDWGPKFSINGLVDSIPDLELSLDQVKIIVDFCKRMRGTIKEFEINIHELLQEDRIGDYNVEWLAEVISNISVDHLTLSGCGSLFGEAAGSIGVALGKNKSIKILDLSVYGEEDYMLPSLIPIFKGISQNSSIKILSMPHLSYYQLFYEEYYYIDDDVEDQLITEETGPQSLNEDRHIDEERETGPQYLAFMLLFSNHQPCLLQVLDLRNFSIATNNDLEIFRKICHALESNTSIHTLVTFTHGFDYSLHSSVFDIVDQMLNHNFTLLRYALTDIQSAKFISKENRDKVFWKLKRNKKLFLSQRSIDYYLLSKLIKSNVVNNFPCEISFIIFDFYLDLLLSEIPYETYLPYIDFHYAPDYYPFSHKDIYELIAMIG